MEEANGSRDEPRGSPARDEASQDVSPSAPGVPLLDVHRTAPLLLVPIIDRCFALGHWPMAEFPTRDLTCRSNREHC